MNTNKDELLDKIIQLEKSLVASKENKQEIDKRHEAAKKSQDETAAALEIIRKQFEEARLAANAIRDQRVAEMNKIQTYSRELEALKRELKRVSDKERVDREYAQRLEAFRAKCLDAPWRKENRTDGLGALPHQIEGAMHLAVAGQALLGDKRGLGKSLTSLITADFVGATKIIVICPPDTMDNYIREINLWTPHRSVVKLGKVNKATRDFILPVLKNTSQYVLVINYQAWRKDDNLIQDLVDLRADTLIMDEAHHAKELKTKTGKGVHRLRFTPNECPHCGNTDSSDLFYDPLLKKEDVTCRVCEHTGKLWEFSTFKTVLPMSGTPILNRPQELYPQLKLIMPDVFKTEYDFLRDFCEQNYERRWVWKAGGESKVVNLLKHRFLVRDRKSAGVIIPPAQQVLHLMTKDEMKENYEAQYKAYEQVRKYAQLVLDPDSQLTMSMTEYITVLMRLRQVNTWPAGIELKYKTKDGDVIVLGNLNVHESIKLDKAEELIREIIDEGERVVLFSQFKAPLEVLQKRLGSRVAIYNGDTSHYLKQQIQLDFDPKTAPDKPKFDAVLCNYRAAGEGLNFNSASQMIILDEEWNPGKMAQAYGRIDRLGQSKETTIHTLRVEQTVDDWLANLIKEKSQIIDGFEGESQAFQQAFEALLKGNI